MSCTTVEYPTQEELNELFTYDSDAGLLYWKIKPAPGVRRGSPAGYVDSSVGYHCIKLRGVKYRSHNLIWVMHYGAIPQGLEVDHRDHIRSNNRLSNLRLLNRAQQTINTFSRGFSKKKGRIRKPWCSQHQAAGKSFHLGYFECALIARLRYEREIESRHPGLMPMHFTTMINELIANG